ncbi:trypsin-like peptidase domain-containing protein [Streptomyces sp. NPDC048436]|uniref:trypsin-like serine peptidase n=1 Tax=Streptomyces sp. NPDC048436 TaxID=3365550 RepID=UPI0037241927
MRTTALGVAASALMLTSPGLASAAPVSPASPAPTLSASPSATATPEVSPPPRLSATQDPTKTLQPTGTPDASLKHPDKHPDQREKEAEEGTALKATQEEIAEARAAEAYWTPDRIAKAVPANPDKGVVDGVPKTAGDMLRSPSNVHNNGVATAGVFLINQDDDPQSEPGKRDQFCSASSVASPNKSLVITAAHCLNDNDRFRNLAFAPGWKADPQHKGRGIAPYGVFPIKKGKVWIDGRYLSLGSQKADDLDFAFLRTGPNSKGKCLENATGMGNELTTLPASGNLNQRNVTLIGFPGSSKSPRVCPKTSTKAYAGRFLEIACDGFAPGVSGGPFLRNFDGKRGDVIGVIGGYKTGGKFDNVSYSSQFDADVVRLYNQAVNDHTPDKPSQLQGMGDAGLWRHATAAATGQFHTSSQKTQDGDLVVKWSDGEMTLYPGDQSQGFYTGCAQGQPCETRLAKPNKMWADYAEVITVGDYTGSNAYDLMVKWIDGEVTIYKDIDEHTQLPTSTSEHPANEITVAKAGSTWKYAKGIATGKYGGNKWADDLVVRWVDGEVTRYTNVDGGGFHAERQLLAPNALWKQHASVIAGGDFDGTANSDFDLFVRWSDGELTIYEDVGAHGLGKENQLKGPNGTWKHARVIAPGEFGGNLWEDDVFVRWSDGEVSVYGNTQADALGREYQLVPPG